MQQLLLWFVPLVLLLVLLFGAGELLKLMMSRWRGTPTRGPSLPYRRKDYLLTKAERSFYEVLKVATAHDDVQIFAKVRLWDLLWLPSGTPDRTAHRNRVTSKHVDFVLCDPTQLRPLLVIELNDASHDREDRLDRDELVRQVLGDAGLPLLMVPARSSYSTAALAEQIADAMASKQPGADGLRGASGKSQPQRPGCRSL